LTDGFTVSSPLWDKKAGIHSRRKLSSTFRSATATTSAQLLESIAQEPKNATLIQGQIAALEEQPTTAATAPPLKDDDPERFAPLVGLYNVSHTQTVRAQDNPVGGKWTRPNGVAQKFLSTRRSLQHILPVNDTGRGGLFGQNRPVVGEAVNVISLDAFFGLLRVTVILRGDAIALTQEERTNTSRVSQPLSPWAVQALFDPPKIVFGKTGRINLNIGPKTSVFLDATYCDDLVRIGMGGTSGTRFVFGRCPDDDVEANEFRSLLLQPPVPKAKALVALGAILLSGFYTALAQSNRLLRVVSGGVALVSSMVFALVAFSSGGIERDGDDTGVVMRNEGDQAAASTS
jgi:hypothetical protein